MPEANPQHVPSLCLAGAVWVSGRLDEVAGTVVEFNVWAIDGGDPRRECVAPAPVAIAVRNVKVPPLAFPQSHYSAVLYLPTFPGVRVICLDQAEAVQHNEDTDWSQVKYSILDGDETKRFEFDSVSRCLYVHDQLNLKPHYNITLKATDGSITSTATAEITVQDAPPSTLVFTKDKYWAYVYENSTKEMNMVALGVRGQPLNHHVHYSILNPTDNFEIRPTAGVIKTTGKPFDREAKDHYSLVVQVR